MSHAHRGTEPTITLNIAVLTVSDSRTPEDDTSGDYLVDSLTQNGHQCVERAIAGNDVWQIRKVLCDWIADPRVQVIITNGGTGYTHNKSTGAAVMPLLDQAITGFGELFRHLSYLDIGSSAVQSDAFAGLANGTLIFCIPGSTGACKLAWEGIIREQLDSRQAPCNFATLYS
ncbi:MAG TPA: molybdenum cofactor biosynthesis protein B [Burkholderiaceae bacterium]|nr:molybdenum cofactor biosynthesis protein B [Burkholderiaceae bacterium]